MSGLYFHIPFCKQACSYCDFYFVTNTEYREHFVEKLIDEINSYRESSLINENVETVYFGGGTPSLLQENEIERILKNLDDIFGLSHVQEITLEMNPDDVSKEFIDRLHKCGITRASMGVQTFNSRLLTFMHRAHSREDALRCLDILSASDLLTYSVDVIYGNPGQSLDDLKADIDTLLKFNPPHISAYSLTIEPRTRLGKLAKLGRLNPADEEIVNQHFDMLTRLLSDNGIFRYEVSNYSRIGHEAIHNSNYWEHKNYLGFGPAAHSFWWSPDKKSADRWKNVSDLKSYLRYDFPAIKESEETLSMEVLGEERIMLGLRTRKGINNPLLEEKYHYHFSEKQNAYIRYLDKAGFLGSEDPLILNDSGLKLADHITLELISRH